MTFGLTSAGFTPKTLTDIKTDLEEAFKNSFGASIDLSATSVYGQLIGNIADRLAEVWELTQGVYTSPDPEKAQGDALDAVCAITGTIRLPAEPSTVVETLIGTAGTVIPIFRQISVAGVGTLFQTIVATTILAAPAWVALTAYVVGQRVKNGGNVYQCITAGTSAGSGGPLTTSLDITDASVHWRFLGVGTGAVDVDCESIETGPKVALSGTLTAIETPIAGWASAVNLLDATLGSDIETDVALRLRRENELTSGGGPAIDAIRAAVLKVGEGTANPVTACIVFQNNTMSTNGDGLPPKAVEVLVEGGLTTDLLNTIFAKVAAGIQIFGSTTGTVKDSAGNDQDSAFSRPTPVTVYVVVHVTKDPAEYPSNGDAQIQALLGGLKFPIGLDVRASALSAKVFAIPGVLDITALFIGTAPAPGTSVTIVCTSRQEAQFDSSRVSVTSIDGTP